MKRFAYLLLAVACAAALVVWLRRAPQAAPSAPTAQAIQAPALALETQLEAPAEGKPAARRVLPRQRKSASAPNESGASTYLLHVRSSVGLPLLWVEGKVEGGEWERAELEHDAVEIESGSPGFLLRAAGHVAIEVTPSMRELALEPDALLTIDAPHLRTTARELVVRNREDWGEYFVEPGVVNQSGVLAEFPDADHLLVAFSPAAFVPAFRGDVLVSFLAAGGRRIEISVRALSGLRASWSIPRWSTPESAPLELELVNEGEHPASLQLSIGELEPRTAEGSQLELSWGSIRIGAPSPPAFPGWIQGCPSRTRLGELELGRGYYICGVDSNGRYGMVEFVHDGREQRLVLGPPYLVVGQVVDAEDGKAIAWLRVFARPLADPGSADWSANCYPRDEHGGFELHLPAPEWGRAGTRPERLAPERFELEVAAAGHSSARLEIAWEGRRRVDLGEIALARNPCPIPVGMDDRGLGPNSKLEGLSFGDQPQLRWSLRRLVEVGDGSRELELCFEKPDAGGAACVACRDLVSGESSLRPFTRELGDRILMAVHGEALAYQRGEKHVYERVERVPHALAIECARLPEGGGAWTLGWRGGGTWASFRSVNAAGKVCESLALPGIATELWWSAGEAPSELCKRAGGALRLEDGAQTLVLR
ncbi:MAG: hypothetical protein IPJ19_09845 [Planctomycetes bacterium]|nr:hypothetical protein [Planctomycetota bacterium]